MSLGRLLAAGLALNRVAMGVRYLVRPSAAGPTWVGRRTARRAQAHVLTRGLAARDVALGIGALAAITRGDRVQARDWMCGHALADGVDLIATVAVRDRLPRRGGSFATAMATGSTAIACTSVLLLSRGG